MQEHWFRDKQFTADFTSAHFPTWDATLSGLRDDSLRILEVGSWEGRSAVFWLEYFPRSHVTCIDTFAGGARLTSIGHPPEGVEARFDANMAPYGQRVRKIKNRSALALAGMAGEGATFDLIYIDGSHERNEVLVDSLLCWPLLKEGGYIIWDDYYLGLEDRPPAARPQQAIDLFLDWHSHELSIADVGSQVIARRTKNDSPGQTAIVYSRTLANLWRFLRRKPLQSPRGSVAKLK
jgi:predicted O-methyltransferase YrrM